MYNHLKVPESWNSYFSKYPQGLTIMEALLDWVGQVDSMIDHINTTDEHIKHLEQNLEEFYLRFDSKLTEQIQNTLQSWIEDGTLEQVISQLIENRMTYPNIPALQQAPNIFRNGTVVELLGYHSAGDGAGHKRIISDEDDGSGVVVGNKFANLICKGTVQLEFLGAKTNDSAFDNSDIFNFAIQKYRSIKLNSGIYHTKKPIILKYATKITGVVRVNYDVQAASVIKNINNESVFVFDEKATGGTILKDFRIEGETGTAKTLNHAINFNGAGSFSSFDGLHIYGVGGDGLHASNRLELGIDNCNFQNLKIEKCDGWGAYLVLEAGGSGFNTTSWDNVEVTRNFKGGVFIERAAAHNINRLHAFWNGGNGIYIKDSSAMHLNNCWTEGSGMRAEVFEDETRSTFGTIISGCPQVLLTTHFSTQECRGIDIINSNVDVIRPRIKTLLYATQIALRANENSRGKITGMNGFDNQIIANFSKEFFAEYDYITNNDRTPLNMKYQAGRNTHFCYQQGTLQAYKYSDALSGTPGTRLRYLGNALRIGDNIQIIGAGVGGANLETQIIEIDIVNQELILKDATSTTVSNATGRTIQSKYQKIEYSTSAPSTGSYQVGDIVYNIYVNANKHIGWVCTASGSPGTFEKFGAVITT